MSNHNMIRVTGGRRLEGVIDSQGAKNAVLPAIAAALLASKGETVLHNVPNIQDVMVALEIVKSLGAKVTYDAATRTAVINAETLATHIISSNQSAKLRGSILFLGALLGRLKHAELAAVGGCRLGERKIDFHHRGFLRLGAVVDGDGQTWLSAKADVLRGNYLYLDTPSHTGTENLLMAACLAEGESIIDNASSEPELENLADMLIKMGAKITGVGSRTLHITGVKELHAVEHTIIPDRHDISAFVAAVGITGGDILIKNVIPENQRLWDAKMSQMGLIIDHINGDMRVIGPKVLQPINIITNPYPGFPTDAQSVVGAMATVAKGKSYIRETIYEGRAAYLEELEKLGAHAVVNSDRVMIFNGVERLHGAEVVAPDLRGGFSLIVAGLVAEGSTTIHDSYHIHRGHERVLERFQTLNADIAAVPDLIAETN